MYQKAAALWHLLSAEEKADWESGARTKHMTGFAWFMSQCLKPNPGIYLPLQGGIMQGDIDMADHKITDLPQPATDQEAATKKYVDDAAPGAASKIQDADGDTTWDVEESPDEDIVRGRVKGVEAFHLHDTGVLTLVKQSAAAASLERAFGSEQSVPTATNTKIQYEDEEYDIQGEYDHITNYRFTAKTAGKYLATLSVELDGLANGARLILSLWKNGSEHRRFLDTCAGATSDIGGSGAAVVSLAVNDYLEGFLAHWHGSNRNISRWIANNTFTITKVA